MLWWGKTPKYQRRNTGKSFSLTQSPLLPLLGGMISILLAACISLLGRSSRGPHPGKWGLFPPCPRNMCSRQREPFSRSQPSQSNVLLKPSGWYGNWTQLRPPRKQIFKILAGGRRGGDHSSRSHARPASCVSFLVNSSTPPPKNLQWSASFFRFFLASTHGGQCAKQHSWHLRSHSKERAYPGYLILVLGNQTWVRFRKCGKASLLTPACGEGKCSIK